MNRYPFDRSLFSERDVLDYYLDAINYRNDHKDESVEIALHVFRRTNPNGMLSFSASRELERLRFEFGALEAPGWSNDEKKTFEDSQDEAWSYVAEMVEKQEKQDSFKDLS